jgi:hypothetical protein
LDENDDDKDDDDDDDDDGEKIKSEKCRTSSKSNGSSFGSNDKTLDSIDVVVDDGFEDEEEDDDEKVDEDKCSRQFMRAHRR